MSTPRSNWLSQAITADALKRFPQSIAGQVVFATGLVMMLAAGVGLPSWEILHQGLSQQLGIEIGTAAQLSGIFVLLLWIPLRQRPGLGTLSNIVIIGWVMNVEIALLAYAGVPPAAEIATQPLLAGALAIAGTAIVGIGSGIYIGSGNGPGPRDGLMTGLNHRTGQAIWKMRTAIEVVVGILGIVLGGTFGFGTIWFAFTIGPQVQFWLGRLDRGGLAKRQAAAADRR
ncbi:MAG: hypothetical protein EXR56_02105 [Chloroflexi bacterium]|nr:hypothetical protein [Chloroflexota bacterium]